MTTRTQSRRFDLLVRLWRENEWLYLVVGLVAGILILPLLALIRADLPTLLVDLVPEAIGITFTVVILDRLDGMREERQMRDQLIRHMYSRYNHTALQAIEDLRVLGYLSDGTVANLSLRGSNWKEGNLYQADLRNTDLTNARVDLADFVQANLEGSTLSDAQLATTWTMHGATMPDGSRYNGRFNLPGDYRYAVRSGVDVTSPEAIAKWYGVPLQDYLDGQQWAKANLGREWVAHADIEPQQ